MSNKTESKKYIAYAEFSWNGKEYAIGEEFVLPNGWERDLTFEEFRNLDGMRRNNAKLGLAFQHQAKIGERRNDETGATEAIVDNRRAILPVDEKASATKEA